MLTLESAKAIVNAFESFGWDDWKLVGDRYVSPSGKRKLTVETYQRLKAAAPPPGPGPKVPDSSIQAAVPEHVYGQYQAGQLPRRRVMQVARKHPDWPAISATKPAAPDQYPGFNPEKATYKPPPGVKPIIQAHPDVRQATAAGIPEAVNTHLADVPPQVKTDIAHGLNQVVGAKDTNGFLSAMGGLVKYVAKLPLKVARATAIGMYRMAKFCIQKAGGFGKSVLAGGGMAGGAWGGAQLGGLLGGPLGAAIGTGVGGAIGALAGTGNFTAIKNIFTLRGALTSGPVRAIAVPALAYFGTIAAVGAALLAPWVFPAAMAAAPELAGLGVTGTAAHVVHGIANVGNSWFNGSYVGAGGLALLATAAVGYPAMMWMRRMIDRHVGGPMSRLLEGRVTAHNTDPDTYHFGEKTPPKPPMPAKPNTPQRPVKPPPPRTPSTPQRAAGGRPARTFPGDIETFSWQLTTSRNNHPKAVWQGAGTRKPLYGQSALAVVQQQRGNKIALVKAGYHAVRSAIGDNRPEAQEAARKRLSVIGTTLARKIVPSQKARHTISTTARVIGTVDRLLGKTAAAILTGVGKSYSAVTESWVGKMWTKVMDSIFGKPVDGKGREAKGVRGALLKTVGRGVGKAITAQAEKWATVRDVFRKSFVRGLGSAAGKVFGLFQAKYRANIKKLGGGPLAVLGATAIEMTAGVLDWVIRGAIAKGAPAIGTAAGLALGGPGGAGAGWLAGKVVAKVLPSVIPPAATARGLSMWAVNRHLRGKQPVSAVRQRKANAQILLLGPQGGKENISDRESRAVLDKVSAQLKDATGKEHQYDPKHAMGHAINKPFMEAVNTHITDPELKAAAIRAMAIRSNRYSMRRERGQSLGNLLEVVRQQRGGTFAEQPQQQGPPVGALVNGVQDMLRSLGHPEVSPEQILPILGASFAAMGGDQQQPVETFAWKEGPRGGKYWLPEGKPDQAQYRLYGARAHQAAAAESTPQQKAGTGPQYKSGPRMGYVPPAAQQPAPKPEPQEPERESHDFDALAPNYRPARTTLAAMVRGAHKVFQTFDHVQGIQKHGWHTNGRYAVLLPEAVRKAYVTEFGKYPQVGKGRVVPMDHVLKKAEQHQPEPAQYLGLRPASGTGRKARQAALLLEDRDGNRSIVDPAQVRPVYTHYPDATPYLPKKSGEGITFRAGGKVVGYVMPYAGLGDNRSYEDRPYADAQVRGGKTAVVKRPLAEVLLKRAQEEAVPLTNKYLAQHGTKDATGRIVGATFNTDEWRPLFPEYTGTNAAETHDAASYLNDRAFEQALSGLKGRGNNKMIVLAGGGGSGKGTATKMKDIEAYPLRLDQVSGDYDKLMKKFALGQQHGFAPEYMFIDRHPEKAWEGVVGRAISGRAKGGPARTVPLDIALKANLDARDVALRVLKERPDIPASVIDNNGGPADARMITDRAEAIRFLEGQKHEFASLRQRLLSATAARADLPEDIRKGLLGSSNAGPAASAAPGPANSPTPARTVPATTSVGQAGAGRKAQPRGKQTPDRTPSKAQVTPPPAPKPTGTVRKARTEHPRQLTAQDVKHGRAIQKAVAGKPNGIHVSELRAATGLPQADFDRLATKLHDAGVVRLLDDGTRPADAVRSPGNRMFARITAAKPNTAQTFRSVVGRQRTEGHFSEHIKYFPVTLRV